MENKRVRFLDGGMGTLLQTAGLPPGKDPADWNIENPAVIASVHRRYIEAGSDLVLTNTFGANRLKYHGRYQLADIIRSALAIARKEAPVVALDIGPTGKLLKPAGDLDFEAAVAAFRETIEVAFGGDAALFPDALFVETMSDLYELKAAVIAAKSVLREKGLVASIPIYCTVALQTDGTLLTGGNVEAFAALMETLGVDAYGFNCGLGPDRMLPFVEQLSQLSTHPIIVKPNAGMPRLAEGATVFDVGSVEFAGHVRKLIAAGASIVGGCCGTTPEYIAAVKSINGDIAHLPVLPRSVVSSGTVAVELKPYAGLIIGERLNPTGKKLLKAAYEKGDSAYVLREAVKQLDAGAEVLDVNCGVPGLDEASLLEATLEKVQSVAACPLQIDTADPSALRRALRVVNGKPLVNSVNGKRESMDAVFPLVKEYGGLIVALCLDENGIPSTAEGRLAIARKILSEGEKYGFTKNDFIFDALTLSVSAPVEGAANAQVTNATVTLETVRRLTEELKVNTILGVSNVSFGLPNRAALNNTMYALAKRAGLSAAIVNPAVIRDEIDADAEDVLLGRDANAVKWIDKNSVNLSENANLTHKNMGSVPTEELSAAIKRGLRADAESAAKAALSAAIEPMEVINTAIIPALEAIGKLFESGKLFLPQLLLAADAAGDAFAIVKEKLTAKAEKVGTDPKEKVGTDPRRPIILATVKGDIHDIGKNIVRVLLESYGFEVIDLGRDVEPEKIVEAARKSNAYLVGLSALMTTTVGAMAETIRRLKAEELDCRTVVGGAVVTAEFAESIGADFYAQDAMRTVRIASMAN